MISINNLSIYFGGNPLFQDINFSVSKNDRIGLIGRNGSGKTTILKIIAGVIQPETGIISAPKNYKIGFLPQELHIQSRETLYDEIRSSLVEIESIRNEIEDCELQLARSRSNEETISLVEKIEHLNYRYDILGGNKIDAEIEQTLTGLGFKRTEFNNKVESFSGGWRMRIELAKILLAKPDLIMLDEPTNHLDINSLLWLEKFLKNYFGSLIIVSHDTNFLDNVTNRTIELANKRIYDYKLSYSEFVEYRIKQREQQLAAFNSQQKEIERIEKFIDRFRYKSTLASRVQSKIKMLEKIDRIEIDEIENSSIDLRFPPVEKSSLIVCEAVNLSKNFGDKQVLTNLNFEIVRGSRIAFVGNNGEGKSTLCKIFARQLDYQGKLYFGNYLHTQYFSQMIYDELNPNNTILEEVERVAINKTQTEVRTILGAFLFNGDDVFKKIKVLSGGEKSRVALAKIVVQPCNFLIMDEPTNHLDVISKAVLKDALLNFEGTLIIVSHDRDFLLGLTQETWEIKNHQIIKHLGDFEIYLEKIQNNQQNQNSTFLNEQNTNNIFDEPNDYEVRKQLKREIEKHKREISKIENDIAILEEKINKLEIDFANPDFITDTEKMIKSEQIYKELKSKLTLLIERWEIEHLSLESKINKLEIS